MNLYKEQGINFKDDFLSNVLQFKVYAVFFNRLLSILILDILALWYSDIYHIFWHTGYTEGFQRC